MGKQHFFTFCQKNKLEFNFFITAQATHFFNMVWLKMFAGVYFCSLAIFNVLRELLFAN